MAKKQEQEQNANYRATISKASFELSPKEKVMYKDTSDCVKLDEVTQYAEGDVYIDVKGYVILDVHNEKSDNVDYKVYLIIDKDGTKYVTGSQNFFNSFMAIFEEMEGVEEEWKLKVLRKESKNYKGKEFLTCTLV